MKNSKKNLIYNNMKHIKPIQIYLGKYGTHPTDVDSDEEKIWKYAESLYGNRCVNSKQKLEICVLNTI